MSTTAFLIGMGVLSTTTLDPTATEYPPPDVPQSDASATCIGGIGPEPNIEAPTRWPDLLPTVTIGFDLRPRRNANTRFETVDHAGVASDDHSSQQNNRTRRMRRWTVNLQWRSGAVGPSTSALPSRPAPLARWCRQYMELGGDSPSKLRDAVDYWTERSRLRALIDITSRPEARHE